MELEIQKNGPQPEKPKLNPNLLAEVMRPDLLSAADAAALRARGIPVRPGIVSSIFISANLYKQFSPSAINSLRPTFQDGIFGVVFFEQTPQDLKTWFLDFPPIAVAAGAAQARAPQLAVRTKAGIKLIARALVSGQVPEFPYGRLKQVFDWNSLPALDAGIFIDWPLLVAEKNTNILALKSALRQSEQLRAELLMAAASRRGTQTQSPTATSQAQPPQPEQQASFLQSPTFGACVFFIVLAVLIYVLTHFEFAK